jgi:transposase
MEDWAEIRRLSRAEGMAIKAIARRLGVARNTVKRALAAHEPPRYVRTGTDDRRHLAHPPMPAATDLLSWSDLL